MINEKKSRYALQSALASLLLLAPFSDKSMIRDVLTFELLRPYSNFVASARYGELILDGTYHKHDEELSSSCEIVRLIVFILLKGKVKLVSV